MSSFGCLYHAFQNVVNKGSEMKFMSKSVLLKLVNKHTIDYCRVCNFGNIVIQSCTSMEKKAEKKEKQKKVCEKCSRNTLPKY